MFSLLKQFGEIEDCQIDENNLSAVITYKTRAEAEQVGQLSDKQTRTNGRAHVTKNTKKQNKTMVPTKITSVSAKLLTTVKIYIMNSFMYQFWWHHEQTKHVFLALGFHR